MTRPGDPRDSAPERRGHVTIDAALDALLKSTGLGRRDPSQRIFDAWQDAAGDALNAHCTPLRFRHGELLIEVRSAALLHELENFRTAELRAALNSRLPSPQVTKLCFKAQS